MNTTKIDQPPNVMCLAQIWMLVQEMPLTDKEFGQLKCLRKRLGPDIERFIKFVLHNWPEFTDRVKSDTGFVKDVPPLPQVGFLLRFYTVATGMMADACP